MNAIESNVNEVFRTVFKDANLNIHPAMTAAEVDNWTSMTHVEMIAAVEKKFGIKFKLSEITKMANVGDLLKLIEAKTNNN